MINSVSNGPGGRIGGVRPPVGPGQPSARSSSDGQRPATSGAATSAAEIAALGAPIDAAKIAQVKAAIAEGRYPVDPAKIAERMIAEGFGPR